MAKKKRRSASRKRRRRLSGDPSLAPSVISGTRRKTKRKTRRKRGKMGFVTGNELGDVLLGFAGGFATAVGVNKLVPAEYAKMKKYIGVGAGTLATIIGSTKKKPILLGFGLGLGAPGAMGIAQDAGLISGMDEFMSGIGMSKDDEMLIEMNGVEINDTNFMSGNQNMLNPSVIGNDNDKSEVNATDRGGMPSIVSGY